jgi:hypothetical protein
LDCDSFPLMLASHSIPSGIQKLSVEGCSCSLARGEDTVEIGITDSNGAVLHTQGAEAESGNSADLANALGEQLAKSMEICIEGAHLFTFPSRKRQQSKIF